MTPSKEHIDLLVLQSMCADVERSLNSLWTNQVTRSPELKIVGKSVSCRFGNIPRIKYTIEYYFRVDNQRFFNRYSPQIEEINPKTCSVSGYSATEVYKKMHLGLNMYIKGMLENK